MIIWRGWGVLVLVLGAAALLLTQWLTRAISGDALYYQSHRWPTLVAMALAAAGTWVLHQALSRKQPRIVIDKDTGQEIAFRKEHSLFFIPVKWWPVIYVAVGVAVQFAEVRQ